MPAPVKVAFELDYRGLRFADAARGLEAFARDQGDAVRRIPDELARLLQSYLDEVRRALVRRHSRPFNNPANVPATGERDLLRRTGGGASGIKAEVRNGRTIASVSGVLSVPWPMSVHEEGATIRPRNSQYLTVPLPAALDSRGVPLRPRARDWDSTFVAESRRGNLLIFQRRGAGIVPLYLLKREVQLPPRLRARETLDAGADFFVDRAVEAVARTILGQRRGRRG